MTKFRYLSLCLYVGLMLPTLLTASSRPTQQKQKYSFDLIDKAVAKKTLTFSKGMRYKFYAVFETAQLPVQFQGTVRRTEPQKLIFQYKAHYRSLEPVDRDAVQKYLNAKFITDGQEMDFRDVADGSIRIHWRKNYPPIAVKIPTIANEIETKILPAIKKCFKKQMVSDLGLTKTFKDGATDPKDPTKKHDLTILHRGGSGALDIYLVDQKYIPKALGVQIAYTPELSSFVLVQDHLNLYGADGLVPTIAHELFHCWQNLYKTVNTDQALWLHEGTATWFDSYLYPKHNGEHSVYPAYLNTLSETISKEDKGVRIYGVATFFHYLFGMFPLDLNHTIYEKTESLTSELAVDAAISEHSVSKDINGFHRVWGSFLSTVWNDTRYGFLQRDGYTHRPQEPARTRFEVGDPGTGRSYPLKDPISYLSGRYYYFVFTSDNARMISIYDGLTWKLSKESSSGGRYWKTEPLPPLQRRPHTIFQVLGKINGKWKSFAPSSGKRYLCRDMKKERIEALLIITGNSNPKDSVPIRAYDEPPTVVISNAGCYGWVGSATVTSSASGSTYTATAEWMREPSGYQYTTSPLEFVLKTASVNWNLSRKTETCTASGSGSWTVNQKSWTRISRHQHQPKLAFELGYLSGQSWRAGGGTGGLPFAPSYQETCHDASGKRSGSRAASGVWFSTHSDAGISPKLSADGTTWAGTLKDSTRTTTFSFKAVRE